MKVPDKKITMEESGEGNEVVEALPAWQILVVDDEEEVHRLTQMVLEDYTFENRSLEVIAAFSGQEAMAIMKEQSGIALVMLDVVMETDEAGLAVVKYIRGELKNDIVQIVLRTGQPGLAPPQEIITEYDINSYNSKVELTAQKIFTIVTASLRAYKLANSLLLANQRLKEELAQRKKAELEIQKLNEFQKSVIDNTVIWLSVFDSSEKIVIWNQAAENISGYSFDEIKKNGYCWEILFDDNEQIEKIRRDFKEKLKISDFVDNYETKITCKGGSIRVVSWSLRRYVDESGQFSGFVLLGRDVTELKELEKQFLQAQKMEAVGRLAGGIAHDFNNMLTVIRGHCELLSVKLTSHDPIQKKVSQIDKAAERAEELTNQILAFSKHRIKKPANIDLKEILRDSKEMIDRLIDDNVRVVLKFDSKSCIVKADPGQIEQIVMNLVVNACDAMPDGGKLIIELKKTVAENTDAGMIQLSVEDTGIGMPDKVLENIFVPFFTTKGKGKGTGLGLSTVYGLVNQIQGSIIRVESSVGNGSKFLMSFPEEDVAESPLMANKEDVSKELHGDETILVVEDQQEVLEMTSELLRYYGYNVLEAQNAGSALLICEKYGFDVDIMLTDVRMDLMDGTQLAKRVQILHPEIRILFMSGYAESTLDQVEMIEPGVNFIQKPFDISHLLLLIRVIMEHPAPVNVNNFS